jgi:hypothetical protein
MTVFGSDTLSTADVMNEYPKGTLRDMVYLLEERCPLQKNLHMKASNKTTSHVSTFQVGEPTVTLRQINEGVASSIGTTEQVEDGMTIQAIQMTTDIDLLEMNDDPNEVRTSQMRMAMNSLVKSGEGLYFYGTPADDIAEFYGLSNRAEFNVAASDHVVDASGSGSDNASIWLIYHHPDVIHSIFPKNARGGVYHKDWGPQLVQTAATLGGGKIPAVVDEYKWITGLVVKDPRQICRIANIDVSELGTLTGDQEVADLTNVIFSMTKAMHRIFAPSMGQPAWYMGRSIAEGMAIMAQSMTHSNVFSYEQVHGKGPKGLHAHGIPVFISDQLLYDEAQVV